jgi:hypothetical protein
MGTCSNNVSKGLKFCQNKHFREHSLTFPKNIQQVLVREINHSTFFELLSNFITTFLKCKNDKTSKNHKKFQVKMSVFYRHFEKRSKVKKFTLAFLL